MVLSNKVTLLALLNVALITAAIENGLSARDQQLAIITGSQTLEEIQQVFLELFENSDIDEALKTVSEVTSQPDAVDFLTWCLEITDTDTLTEASKIFLTTSREELTFIALLDKTANNIGHDLKLFYIRLCEDVGEPNLPKTMEVLPSLVGESDLFEILDKVRALSSYTDPMEMHQAEFVGTHSKDLKEVAAKLTEATSTPDLVQALQLIHKVTNADVYVLLRTFGTLDTDSWPGVVEILTTYTGTSDFMSALEALPAATGQPDAIKAVEHIRDGHPPAKQ